MRSFRRVLLVLVTAAAAVAAAGIDARAAAPGPLRIAFPEGWSAGQMADRVAEVRRIAIRKRGVTPRLTGTAYRRATAAARPPRSFAQLAQTRKIEGFGLASIRAAARPASVDHLFYVRIPGTLRHFFTADEEEFCEKALEYGYAGC